MVFTPLQKIEFKTREQYKNWRYAIDFAIKYDKYIWECCWLSIYSYWLNNEKETKQK